MITKEQAIEIARAECERRGWPFEPEIKVMTGPFKYTVGTRRQGVGACVFVRINKRSGRIVGAERYRR